MVANPEANAGEIVRVFAQVADSDVVVFPELCVTGYTCADLFGQSALLQAGIRAIEKIAQATAGPTQLVVVGAPVPVGNSLFNCAVVICDGKILGIVPKQHLPNYKEFYENRWFRPADGSEPAEIDVPGGRVPFGIDLLFECQECAHDVRSWWGSRSARTSGCRFRPARSRPWPGRRSCSTSRPATRRSARAGIAPTWWWANPAAAIAAYAYAGAGPSESTTDVVFGGHCLIAENGRLLAESPRVGDGQSIRRDSYWITQDVDVAKLQSDRRVIDELRQGRAACPAVPPDRILACRRHGRPQA